MRYLAMGILLAAVAGAAHGQATTWGAFETGESKGVGLKSADGGQLVLKCDKPGRNEVYALMLTDQALVQPAPTYVRRKVEVRIDDRPVYDDDWRFYEKYVVAINKDRERGTLTRLLVNLGPAKTLVVRLYPEPRRAPVAHTFDVTGAQEAIAQVFESCKDTIPTL